MTDLERFKEQLGNELVAAAHRRAGAPATLPSPRRQRLIPVAAACLLSLVGLAIVPFVRSARVDAETFEITVSDQVIRLDIVDLIVDPEVSQRQLRREIGIDSDFIAVPADTDLVGHVVAVGTTGSIQPDPQATETGFVSAIDVPTNFDGRLTVTYGRSADAGEIYGVNTTHHRCEELFGRPLAESLNALQSIRSTVVARVDLPSERRDVTDLRLIPDDYVVTMVHTVSDEIVRVFLRPGPLTTAQLDQGCRG